MSSSNYDLAELYFEKCDFKKASELYVLAQASFFAEKDYSSYLKCAQRLLRIFAEAENFEAIEGVKRELQELVLKEQITLDSRTYYTLGLCAFYRGQKDLSLEYVEKSLALALSSDSKEDICYAIQGLAINYMAADRLEEALKEIYNLQVFFQVIPLPELEIASKILNAHILRKLGKYDQATDLLWTCYDKLKERKNFLLHLELLYGMGVTYQDAGQLDLARLYLDLAKKSIDPANLKNLSGHIEKRRQMLGAIDGNAFDLVFDKTAKSLTEKTRGRVDFKNQFILLDLLKLFLRRPGEVHSKEEIVEKVWKQNYDPRVHDNKLYVTIKRLRKMIEPEYEKPKYIFRAKNGYYLNKSTRVLMRD